MDSVPSRLTRLPLEQVLALKGGDVRHGGEDIGTVSCRALDAVPAIPFSLAAPSSHTPRAHPPVVDSALSSLVVDVKVLQIVVKVDAARAQVSAEEGRVRGKDGRHVDVALPAQRDCEARLPLVEVSDDGRRGVEGRELPW